MVEGDKAASMTGILVATQIFSGNVNFLREGLYLGSSLLLSLPEPQFISFENRDNINSTYTMGPL